MKKDKLFRLYLSGFILSLVLTIASYIFVVNHFFSGLILVAVILVMAFGQLSVQLLFFLHIDEEPKPRWNLVMFISTLGIILLVVIASIWIMYHLDYNMMASPQLIEKYTQSQDGF